MAQELFRLKIASKRQVTVPQRLMQIFGIGEGDELQIEVMDGRVVSVEPCKVVPSRLFTPEILDALEQREKVAMSAKAKAIASAHSGSD